MKCDLVQSLFLKHNTPWLAALSVTPTRFCVTLDTPFHIWHHFLCDLKQQVWRAPPTARASLFVL